ncbi:Glycerophosphoryl diester phosphodiesterase family protein [Nocardioides terrae]|uniref:Glycerophosphoryl diester phosphodiesterase family protein n=1 Tax=Nocardioides terrae TaxID=574651 RepID=A0A1I1JWW1_9ACTN|nr:glycerophosphodiester phosphodiesterase [Nocardioides terrae]SFC50263.1 Glycerophosphoryl diester phosphodiesterase family protein [Nocardioides terrae]
MSRRARPRVLISAHRGGAGVETSNENTLVAVHQAVEMGADYVELDVQRRPDDSLVVLHDDDGRLDAVRFDDVVAALGRTRAHLDLKFGTADGAAEVEAVRRALDVLGPGPHVATTGRVATARTLRAWADANGSDLKVGISIGGTVAGLPVLEQVRRRWAELFPWPKVAASHADVIAAHHLLAFLTLRRLARRRGLDLLVWTPDHAVLLRYWLRPGRAWLVTTNHPGLAIRIREQHGG